MNKKLMKNALGILIYEMRFIAYNLIVWIYTTIHNNNNNKFNNTYIN